MSPKKTPPTAAQDDAEKGSLDQIMSEIDQLQAEINQATPPSSVEQPKLRVVASNSGATAPERAEAAAEAALGATSEADILEEFRSGNVGEASLDSTLADLGDAPAEGGGILDQILAEETTQSLEREHVASLAEAEDPTEIISDPESPTVTATEAVAEHEEFPMSQKTSDQEGSLTMTLQGSMNLKLKYESDGQEVSVAFSNGFLMVTLADGTEFKVPVARTRAVRKVA